jgi:magnesium transporter
LTVIVDCAIYRDGERIEPTSLDEVYEASRNGSGIAWLGLHEPSKDEIAEIAGKFGLHELAVEDAIHAHQRPKLERYGDMLFLVLRTARYIDETETVEFGEIHVFTGPSFVITIRHGQASELGRVRKSLESRPQLLQRGPMSVVHAIVDRVVDDYMPVVAGIENDIDEIEDQVFSGESGDVSRRIYQLSREVIELKRATAPLPEVLAQLIEESADEEEKRYVRDVEDHAIRVHERAEGFHELLRNILSVNLTLETKALNEAGNRQNEEVKRISAWAAILFAPTLVGTIYGMNFRHMPELKWRLGYPMALGLMFAVSLSLYLLFRRRRWI